MELFEALVERRPDTAPVEDAAHQQAADGGGGLGGHAHQPGQPVLGVPAPHRHVPRVDKQRGAQILARLHTADITS